jgi:hypothetical protein
MFLSNKKYQNPEKRMERAKLLSKWTADIPYYLFASVYKI